MCAVDLITDIQTYTGPGYINHPFQLTASRLGVLGNTFDFDPPVSMSCLAGEDRVLLSITYNNATFCDDTNAVCTLLGGGTYSASYCKDGVNARTCPLF